MRKFTIGFFLTILCVGQSFAGVRYETASADSFLTLDALEVTAWDMRSVLDTVTFGWSGLTTTAGAIWDSPKPNLKTHYISGLDTVITRHRVECDTTTVEKLIINDTTVIRLNVECDTVYRAEYRDVWEPKVKVYLNPGQLKQLMWLIENSDMIEMKKTYGKK